MVPCSLVGIDALALLATAKASPGIQNQQNKYLTDLAAEFGVSLRLRIVVGGATVYEDTASLAGPMTVSSNNTLPIPNVFSVPTTNIASSLSGDDVYLHIGSATKYVRCRLSSGAANALYATASSNLNGFKQLYLNVVIYPPQELSDGEVVPDPTLFNLEIAVEGMTLLNDGNPHSYGTGNGLYTRAQVVQGNVPHNSSLPTWYTPNPLSIKTTVRDWPDTVPWFDVQHQDNAGRPSTNAGVVVRNLRCYVAGTNNLLPNGKPRWQLLARAGIGGDLLGADYYWDYSVNPPAGLTDQFGSDTVAAPGVLFDGGTLYRYGEAQGSWLHGYGGRVDIRSFLDGNVFNLWGIFVAAEYRLHSLNGAPITGPKILAASGCDYYPSGVSAGQLNGYTPGAGCGRHAELTTTWRTMSWWAVGYKSDSDTFVLNESAFRDNPPPLN